MPALARLTPALELPGLMRDIPSEAAQTVKEANPIVHAASFAKPVAHGSMLEEWRGGKFSKNLRLRLTRFADATYPALIARALQEDNF